MLIYLSNNPSERFTALASAFYRCDLAPCKAMKPLTIHPGAHLTRYVTVENVLDADDPNERMIYRVYVIESNENDPRGLEGHTDETWHDDSDAALETADALHRQLEQMGRSAPVC